MKRNEFFLINSEILPSVFKKVILAKELLEEGRAQNVTQATQMADLSRSAFYKYKNDVFKYEVLNENTVSLNALLSDKAGVFSAFSNALYQSGANILTLHQDPPQNKTANISLTFTTDNVKSSIDELLKELKMVDGVISVMVL